MISPPPAYEIAIALAALFGMAFFAFQTINGLVYEIRYRRIRKYAKQPSDVGLLAAEVCLLMQKARARKGSNRFAIVKSGVATLGAAAHLWRAVVAWLSRQ